MWWIQFSQTQWSVEILSRRESDRLSFWVFFLHLLSLSWVEGHPPLLKQNLKHYFLWEVICCSVLQMPSNSERKADIITCDVLCKSCYLRKTWMSLSLTSRNNTRRHCIRLCNCSKTFPKGLYKQTIYSTDLMQNCLLHKQAMYLYTAWCFDFQCCISSIPKLLAHSHQKITVHTFSICYTSVLKMSFSIKSQDRIIIYLDDMYYLKK